MNGLNDKVLSLLGFAAKAGKLSYGAKASLEAAAAKKSKVVLICSDISEKSRKEALFKCNKSGTRTLLLENYDSSALSSAVGRGCGIISVNDTSFSEQLIRLLTVLQGGNANDK